MALSPPVAIAVTMATYSAGDDPITGVGGEMLFMAFCTRGLPFQAIQGSAIGTERVAFGLYRQIYAWMGIPIDMLGHRAVQG